MTTDLAMEPAAATLDVAVDPKCAAWSDTLPTAGDLCRRAALAALASAGIPPDDMEISVVLADDAFVRDLNRQWRDKDTPTNVLAFPCSDAPEENGGVWLLGDIVVAFETTRDEAKTEARRLDHHLSHLVVHGVLHLLGYDHISDEEADRMERLEIVALERLGIDNPYSPIVPEARKTPR